MLIAFALDALYGCIDLSQVWFVMEKSSRSPLEDQLEYAKFELCLVSWGVALACEDIKTETRVDFATAPYLVVPDLRKTRFDAEQFTCRSFVHLNLG